MNLIADRHCNRHLGLVGSDMDSKDQGAPRVRAAEHYAGSAPRAYGRTPRCVVLDVRQPLDLLADSEIIEGSAEDFSRRCDSRPGAYPRDKDLVVYCTCPSDKTSRAIAMKAQALVPNIDVNRVKFLKGGLAAWKAKGYPVVPYDKTFHLDTGT